MKYETANPFRMQEPGGLMDLENVRYEAVNDRAVRVYGSEFHPTEYTVKLEAAQLAGYRSEVIGGITDPFILEDLDAWLEDAKAGAAYTVERALGERAGEGYDIFYRAYGHNAVSGGTPGIPAGGLKEIGLHIIVLAPTQEKAERIAAQAGHTVLHHPIPQWHGLVSTLAFPVAPHVTNLGPAYRFALNHAVELEDPLEIFPIQIEEV
jgi:hypothetical protein